MLNMFSRSGLKSALSSGMNLGSFAFGGMTVPGLRKGGLTVSEGLAFLHAHEYVVPAAKTVDLAAATGVGGSVTVRSYLVLDGKVAAESVNRVNANRENRATGGPSGRRWSRSG